jgi:predicted polyphosphate/ATP-dependent NAD kinase
MAQDGVGCIVTLGGDGTNRAVAKSCGDVPLVPISTGTNNVFPYMVEGTIAGLAAGVVAQSVVDLLKATKQTKRLEIERDGQLIDIALVDAAVYDDVFVASRAIWDMSKVQEVVLARAKSSNIGLSSIGGCLCPGQLDDAYGMYLKLGGGTVKVLAPIAPGLIEQVSIESYRMLKIGEEVEVTFKPSVLALDGEREIEIRKEERVRIRLSKDGPRIVDICQALEQAAKSGFFVR